ncbi:MAG: 23S rRNA (adenine(2030)-N(6))-methyltransferase RlmJ [Burkholderiales bacterium]|nr:MAG: 23S rRNA (adenine(2030)-N(6))-methyltransferase RlmJ [Burkholderiales bacterium]
MFSYRHAFHAGNHGDVLKHLVLVQLLEYMTHKPSALWFVDSHAGGGRYRLDSKQALKRAEFRDGIGRLWQPPALTVGWPEPVRAYLAQVRSVNPDGKLALYPGSPQIALQMLRAQDRLRLFELHPTEFSVLQQELGHGDRRVLLRREDGFAALRAVLPPPTRRALVLIDPSYEDKDDYLRVRRAVQEARKRFASGVYAIWYPLVRHQESHRLADNLARVAGDSWLRLSLTVQAQPAGGLGMRGSAMFVINPPFTLEAALRATLPWLVERLGRDERAAFELQARQA